MHDTVIFRRAKPWLSDEVAETLSEAQFQERFTRRAGDPHALPKGSSFGHKLSPQDIARRNFAKLTQDAEPRRRADDDSIARPVLLAWLEAQGVNADESAPDFKAGVRFMLKALADLGQATQARDDAYWVRWSGPDPAACLYPDAQVAPLATPSPPRPVQAQAPPSPVMMARPPVPASAGPSPPTEVERVRFSEAAGEALQELSRTELERKMRQDEYAKAIELFMGWLDDDPFLDDITSRLAGRYKVDLTYYPKNAAHRQLYRGLTIKQRFATAKSAGEAMRLDSSTINSKYLTPLRRIFEWLREAGRGPEINPFAVIQAHKSKRVDSKARRRDFTDVEVAAMLALPLFTGSKGYKFKPL